MKIIIVSALFFFCYSNTLLAKSNYAKCTLTQELETTFTNGQRVSKRFNTSPIKNVFINSESSGDFEETDFDQYGLSVSLERIPALSYDDLQAMKVNYPLYNSSEKLELMISVQGSDSYSSFSVDRDNKNFIFTKLYTGKGPVINDQNTKAYRAVTVQCVL